MKANESVDATDDLIDLLCEEEIDKGKIDVYYVIAFTVFLGINGVALWLGWGLCVLIWGE